MALNVNELGVIRTYVAITGNAPTQTELQNAFDKTGLNALATALIQAKPAQSNDAFVTDLYTNLLGRAPEADGLQYWSSLLTSAAGPNQLSKARLAVEFQNAAALNAAEESGFVDGTAGLSSVNGEFADGTGPVTDPTLPTEVVFDFDFDTTKGESDVTGWTHQKYDDVNNAPGGQVENTYMSNTNKIFNVGMQAIDLGVGTISRDYTFRMENQLGEMGHYDAYFLSPILDNVTTNLGSVLTVEVIDRMAEANNKDAALSLVAIESFSFRLNGEEVVVSSQDILNAETYEALAAAIQARIEELRAENPALNNVTVELGADFTRQQVDPDTLNTTGANVLGTQILITATGSNLIERGGFGFGDRAGGDRNVDPSGRQDTNVLGSSTDLITTNLELKNVGYGSQGGSVNISGQSMSDRGVQQLDVTAEDHNLDLGVWLTELSSNPLRAREGVNFLEVVNLTGAASYFHLGAEQSAALSSDGGAVLDGKAYAGLTDVRVFNAAQFGQNVRMNAEVTDAVVARDLNLVDGQDNPAAENVVYSYNLGGGDNELYLSFSQQVIGHEDASLSITTGSGNDKVVLVLDNDDIVSAEWYANQKDQKNIVINTGSGNDVVETIGAGDATILTAAGNDTVYTDNSGAQAFVLDVAVEQERETAEFLGFEIPVDPITGLPAGNVNAAAKAHWAFNSTSQELSELNGGTGAPLSGTSGVTGPYFLYDATLTVTFSGATATGAGLTEANAAALTNGFESTVAIPTGSNYAATERHINQAIKNAINADAVLSKYLVAIDGPDDTLVIRSLVDGVFDDEDINIDINAGTYPTSGSAQTQLDAAYQAFASNSGLNVDQDVIDQAAADLATEYEGIGSISAGTSIAGVVGAADLAEIGGTAVAGLDSTVESNNVINLGTGQDVIALGTGLDSNDMLVYTGYNNGHNTVLNFVQDADSTNGTLDANASGVDFLNFTSYLTTETDISGSGSGSSANPSPVVFLDDTVDLKGNTVSIIEFQGSGGNAQQTWDNLTASNLVALLNNAGSGYGAAGNTTEFGDYDADNGETNMGTGAPGAIIGNTNNHIFMVENDANDGEYKIFHVTSTRVADADAGDFNTSAQLVGVVDLGASLGLDASDMETSLVGSAEWAAISGLA